MPSTTPTAGGLTITVDVSRVTALYSRAPEIVNKWLNKAVKAGMIDLQMRGGDSGGANADLFQFKNPVPPRTGTLASRFRESIALQDLIGSIGNSDGAGGYNPYYARYVLRQNNYLDRIAKDAWNDIQSDFDQAVRGIASELNG